MIIDHKGNDTIVNLSCGLSFIYFMQKKTKKLGYGGKIFMNKNVGF